MKFKSEISNSSNSMNLTATIERDEFIENNKNLILKTATDMIASKIAYDFCQLHGKKILSEIALDEVKTRVLLNENIAERERIHEAMISGRCIECGRITKNWESPSGSFAPEAYATLYEQGINPRTGHREKCKYNAR